MQLWTWCGWWRGLAVLGLLGVCGCQTPPGAGAGAAPGRQADRLAAGVVLAAIPAGSFMMGATAGSADEQPVHRVTISRPFWMGRYELTQEQFGRFTAATGYRTTAELMGYARQHNPDDQGRWGKKRSACWRNTFPDPRHPVIAVSYTDAIKFCEWLTAQEATAKRLPEGYVFRLPTEAEWEYCCRAGTSTAFAFGDDPAKLAHYGNFCDRSNTDRLRWQDRQADDRFDKLAPVGSFRPNAWGLYDLHGNAWEWCWDHCWVQTGSPGILTDTYREGVTDPVCWQGSRRIARGGGWDAPADRCRSAARALVEEADYTDYGLGFRIVLAPALTPPAAPAPAK